MFNLQPLVVLRFNLPDLGLTTDLNQETNKGSDVLSFDLDSFYNFFFLNFNNFFRPVNATDKNKRPFQSYDAKRPAKRLAKRPAKRPSKRPTKRPSRQNNQSERQNK